MYEKMWHVCLCGRARARKITETGALSAKVNGPRHTLHRTVPWFGDPFVLVDEVGDVKVVVVPVPVVMIVSVVVKMKVRRQQKWVVWEFLPKHWKQGLVAQDGFPSRFQHFDLALINIVHDWLVSNPFPRVQLPKERRSVSSISVFPDL